MFSLSKPSQSNLSASSISVYFNHILMPLPIFMSQILPPFFFFFLNFEKLECSGWKYLIKVLITINQMKHESDKFRSVVFLFFIL